MSKAPVVHFEMPYDDGARMRRFYEEALGWTMRPLGEEMGHYIIAQTAETDDANMITQKGAINGGFAPRSDETDRTNVVVAVEAIETAMAAVRAAGGKVLDAPIPIPGVGRYVMILDTEGNKLSLLEPEAM